MRQTLIRTGATTMRVAGFLAVLMSLSGVALAGPPVAPELDPGSMMSALALASGGLAILTARRRR